MSRCRAANAAAVSSAPGSSAIVGSSARAKAAAKAAVAVLPPRARRRGVSTYCPRRRLRLSRHDRDRWLRLHFCRRQWPTSGATTASHFVPRPAPLPRRSGPRSQPRPSPPPREPPSSVAVSAMGISSAAMPARDLSDQGLRDRLLFCQQLLREDRLLDQVDHRLRRGLILARQSFLEFSGDATPTRSRLCLGREVRESPRRRWTLVGHSAAAGRREPPAAPPASAGRHLPARLTEGQQGLPVALGQVPEFGQQLAERAHSRRSPLPLALAPLDPRGASSPLRRCNRGRRTARLEENDHPVGTFRGTGQHAAGQQLPNTPFRDAKDDAASLTE